MSRPAKMPLFSVLDSVAYLLVTATSLEHTSTYRIAINLGDGKAFIYSHNALYILSRPFPKARGTQREYSSKALKQSIVKRILVFER